MFSYMTLIPSIGERAHPSVAALPKQSDGDVTVSSIQWGPLSVICDLQALRELRDAVCARIAELEAAGSTVLRKPAGRQYGRRALRRMPSCENQPADNTGDGLCAECRDGIHEMNKAFVEGALAANAMKTEAAFEAERPFDRAEEAF